jgi:hypothetical protein
MAQEKKRRIACCGNGMALDELRKNGMMAHLIDALEQGMDIGHYGRLVFAMVGRCFISNDELMEMLTKDPDCDEEKARALIEQVEARDYNPPKRERILEWMDKQEFPICPDPENRSACNVYRDLDFPQELYDKITSYYTADRQAAA